MFLFGFNYISGVVFFVVMYIFNLFAVLANRGQKGGTYIL